ncbi:MAG: hypothetical protein Q9201_005474 [Fulgogasparrea decipioides]
MSTLSLSVPPEYGYPSPLSFPPFKTDIHSYVLLSATLSSCVNYWHATQTGKYRTAAKVPYPNAYATAQEAKESKEKYLFNCAQRSHTNFLEHQPQFLLSLLVSGLKFPLFSATMGLLWDIARVHYANGYLRPDKTNGAGRRAGFWFYGPQLGLLIGSVVTGLTMTGLGGWVESQVLGLFGR